MSANFFSKLMVTAKKGLIPKKPIRWGVAFGLVVWTLVSFGIAQVILAGLVIASQFFGVSYEELDSTILTAVSAPLVYGLALVILIGVPWWIKKYRTSKDDLGLTRPLSWADIGLAPIGLVVYFFISSIFIYGFTQFAPQIDLTQAQETGFDDVTHYYQYLLVFITLVVIAPIAEEAVFRGYLYGKLRKVMPIWVTMLLTSALFGLVHGQWNVAIDVFALSMVLCGLREITGNIWSGILLHMLKNSLAYYLLFINPTILNTIGG